MTKMDGTTLEEVRDVLEAQDEYQLAEKVAEHQQHINSQVKKTVEIGKRILQYSVSLGVVFTTIGGMATSLLSGQFVAAAGFTIFGFLLLALLTFLHSATSGIEQHFRDVGFTTDD